jgi:Tol biopolymer transport system component/predicted Ser/Thr protein kinase
MNIAPGVRLGPYEVVAAIGAGGMGEVYRANDTRLDRIVAIKILPSHLSSNPQLRERFDREARTISSLTHPHICTLYDVGHQDGVDYLVMEFVEGESLEERLNKGPLPIEQVLRYGIEIAEALDKAHRQGIVHRDLKPANIMLTKSGAKLLDFGLAKIVAAESPVVQLSHMATAQRPLTQEGTILGTFQYMAPEQLEGLEADARTDIFAFGSVLYEMATGRRAFEGKTKTSLIAAIVDRDPPPISSIQPLTPPAFERVVKTCLAKDPDSRWQSARDVANELRWIKEAGSQAGVAAPVAMRRKTREWLAWVLAVVAILAAGGFAYLHYRGGEAAQSVQSAILPPEKANFAFNPATGGMAISPDGRRIVFRVNAEGKTMLWVRPLNVSAAQPLLGTEDATFPFWSPDSRFIAFFSGGKLKKIDANGGPPQPICPVSNQPRGGTWSRDGVILFSGGARDPISKVAAEGGSPVAVTKLKAPEFSHRWPIFLPDGRHFLYFGQTWVGQPTERNKTYVGSLDTGEGRPQFFSTGPAIYVPPGYVIFVRDRMLLGQRFDHAKLLVIGEPFPLVERVESYSGTNAAIFSASDNGVLAYLRGESTSDLHLSWVDRNGKEIENVTPPGDYGHPRLSHDGTRIAYEVPDPQNGLADIWIFDLVRRVPTRLTFEPASETFPIWSPDDQTIVYSVAQPNGAIDLFRKSSTGAGAPERLYTSSALKLPTDWSADGRTLLFQSNDPVRANNWDIEQFSFDKNSATHVIAGQFNEAVPQLSPDGHWLAYLSDLSGAFNVYIEPFPPTGAKYQVSTGGGSQPRWRRDGKELFYRTPDERLVSVTVNSTAQRLQISTPTPLFQVRLGSTSGPGGSQYDVAPEGQKFLMNVSKAEGARPLTLVTNWTAALKP